MTYIYYKPKPNVMVYMKLLDDSVTDDKRKGIYDSDYALFHCNKALVHSIKLCKESGTVIETINDGTNVYVVGQVLQSVVLSIPFFKTYSGAYCFMMQVPENGDYFIFDNNGKKIFHAIYRGR